MRVTDAMVEAAALAISNRHQSNTGVPFPMELCRDDARAALTAALATLPEDAGWRPIESAPKGDNTLLAPAILLGYAPDETGYSPRSVEGYWNHERPRWNWAHDPYFDCPQPTHWQPLPAAPATGQEGK